MGASDWVEIVLAVVALFFAIVGWALRRQIDQHEEDNKEKFEAAEESIKLLFKKHDEDVARLQELREMVLSQHYRREELDLRFKELTDTFKTGFGNMGEKLDRLNSVMTTHIGEHAGVQRTGVVR